MAPCSPFPLTPWTRPARRGAGRGRTSTSVSWWKALDFLVRPKGNVVHTRRGPSDTGPLLSAPTRASTTTDPAAGTYGAKATGAQSRPAQVAFRLPRRADESSSTIAQRAEKGGRRLGAGWRMTVSPPSAGGAGGPPPIWGRTTPPP